MTATQSLSPGLVGFLDRARSGEGARLLRETGLPHRRMEAWRYTNPRSLSEQIYAAPSHLDAAALSALLSTLPDLPGRRVTFVNGVLAEGDAGAHAGDLDREPFETTISPLTALNRALRQPGLTLEVGEGVDEGTVSLTTMNQHETLSSTHLHHRIHLERGGASRPS
ncbi:SufD family Fe-S cluster assembly protein [Sorlinia euscelidii]|uniref:Fe-S cluster assembly protein SufD n=1 Tax=Sorlinia euscelidii TaxID=3081148 RepID=A0ABU7U5Q1_9PROT